MSKKSKDTISRTLIELMETNSFKVITISEICDNTSLVRKTFYNNFESKEAVIVYIVEKLVEEYLKKVQEVKVYSSKEMSYLYFCFGKSNHKIISLLLDNSLFHLFRTEFEKILPSIINDLVPASKMIGLNEDDLEYVFSFYTAGFIRLLELWVKTGFKKSAREMSDIYDNLSHP